MKRVDKHLKSTLVGHIDYDYWMPEEKLKYLKYFPKDVKTVLDVGCGVGELSWLLKKKGYTVEGCDFDDVCIEKTKAIVSKVKFADVQKLSSYYPANSFDLITCTHILEHLPSPHEALTEIRKVTKKYALIAVPNARYITYDERETHLFSWNSITLKNLLEDAGFKTVLLSTDWTNIIPNILRLAPFLNRILLRVFYDPLELIALIQKEDSSLDERR
jgi:SAM-dependent methyltransferase